MEEEFVRHSCYGCVYSYVDENGFNRCKHPDLAICAAVDPDAGCGNYMQENSVEEED